MAIVATALYNSRVGSVKPLPRSVRGYAVALTALGISTLITLATRGTPFRAVAVFLYLVAILVSAWWGGYGAGVLSVLVTAYGAPYLLNPNFHPSRVRLDQLSLLVLTSLLVSKLSVVNKKRISELARANEGLEQRVMERTAELQRANADLRQQGSELRRQSALLARSNNDLREFAHLAAHDLQEPARVISGAVDLLKRNHQGHLDREAMELLTVVGENGCRMHRLVRSVQRYLEAINRESGEPEAVDLAESLAAAQVRLASNWLESGATIAHTELPVLSANRWEVGEVFENLLRNAILYRSATPPRIQVSANQEDGFWIISFQDNGIGIAAEYHRTVFEPFRRLHHYEEIPGAGIGLAICARIAARSGGGIRVESAPGAGSTFHWQIGPSATM